MEKIYRDEMKITLDTLLKNGKLNGKSIFMFGHCNASERMIDYLLDKGFITEAILDNNEAKQTFTYRDVSVKPPICIQDFASTGSIVLIANRFFDSMAFQLRRLNYNGEIVKVVDYDSFAEYSLSIETFSRRNDRMQCGIKTLLKIRKKYLTQHLVVCPHNALGDVYWAMAFLNAYCEKHGIHEIAVVVTGNGCRQVAELFGMENVVTLERIEMDEFVQAIIFTREGNCIIAHHDRPYTDNIIRYLDKYFLSFIDYYRCAVYGLTNSAQPSRPTFQHPLSDTSGFEKNNTVILAPYAKSVIGVSLSFWESVAEDYTTRKFKVLTNVTIGEPPIAGTTAIMLPLNRMIAAVEYAGCFIGVRSGLCDIISSARCRKVVVFPDCYYSVTPYKVKDFFALPEWEEIVAR